MSSQRRFVPVRSGTAGAGGGSTYVYDDHAVLAINIALTTQRPLVIGGPPGCGKSSIGLDVAYNLGWRYYLEVISKATVARDLCYSSTSDGGIVDAANVQPGVLWWAFDADSALTRGGALGAGDTSQRAGIYPEGSEDAPAVVLLDEIDMGPDDVPLGLIDVLRAGGFTVPGQPLHVRARHQPLIIATTNGTRPLPAAFTDQCVVVTLAAPSAEKLVRIGSTHFPAAPLSTLREAADALLEVAAASNAPPNARDYVALVGTQIEKGVALHESAAWNEVIRTQPRVSRPRARGPAPAERPADADAKVDAVRVFISYAREDAAHAHRLYADLARHGHAPWLDREHILPGQNWRMAIEQAIRESALFLAMLSARSVSKAGYVQKEMRQALDVLEEMPPGTVYVVPTRIEECEPTHAVLRDLNWVDLFPSYDDGLGRILQVIDLVPRQLKAH